MCSIRKGIRTYMYVLKIKFLYIKHSNLVSSVK